MMQDPEEREKRRFKRWPASIHCTVIWDELVLKGRIANISFGGALITQINAVPPNNVIVFIRFHYAEGCVIVEGKVESRVIYSIEQVLEEDVIGSFGVEFKEPLKTLHPKLDPVIESLSDETIGSE